jgi:hypothetical protein
VCSREKLLTPGEAAKVFPSYPWGDADLSDDADKICSFCKSAFFEHGKRLEDGRTAYWVRTVTAKERAYALSQAYNGKTRQECKAKITAGEAQAANPGDLE